MFRNLIVLIIICINFFSCSKFRNNQYEFINDVDTIEVFYNVTDSSFKPIKIVLDKKDRELFKKVFNSNPKISTFNFSRTIKFYSNNMEVFETGLTDYKNKNQYLIVINNGKNEGYRLTDNFIALLKN